MAVKASQIAGAFQSGFVDWLEKLDGVELPVDELAKGFAIFSAEFLRTLPVEIRANMAALFFEELNNRYLGGESHDRLH